MYKLEQKPKPVVSSEPILHLCHVCGWVGAYYELEKGRIGAYGYADDPKCPRCHSPHSHTR